jgi:hypothetical protein
LIREDAQTHRTEGDIISLFLLFQTKERKLKMQTYAHALSRSQRVIQDCTSFSISISRTCTYKTYLSCNLKLHGKGGMHPEACKWHAISTERDNVILNYTHECVWIQVCYPKDARSTDRFSQNNSTSALLQTTLRESKIYISVPRRPIATC